MVLDPIFINFVDCLTTCKGTGVHSGQLPEFYYYLPEHVQSHQEPAKDKASEKVAKSAREFLDFAQVMLVRGAELLQEMVRSTDYHNNRFLECTLPALLAQMLVVVKEDKRNVREVFKHITPVLEAVDKINAADESEVFGKEPVVQYLLYNLFFYKCLLFRFVSFFLCGDYT